LRKQEKYRCNLNSLRTYWNWWASQPTINQNQRNMNTISDLSIEWN